MVDRVVNVVWTSTGATRVTSAMSQVERSAVKTAAVTETSAGRMNTAFTKVASGGGIKGTISGLVSLGGGASFAAVAGLTAVAGGLVSVVNAGREQAKAMRLTQAVLTSTGSAAGVTAQDVTNLASKLSLVSGVQDEVIQSGENVLLTFRSVRNEAGKGNDIFTQATTSALDLSAAYGKDLQSSIILVGKALNDPIRGLTYLQRAGIQFTDQQREQIKTLVETGRQMEAQKIILGELKAEFSGAAAAAADPFSKFDASAKELKETIGAQLLPSLNEYVALATRASQIKLPGAGSGSGGDRRIPGGSLFGFLVSPLGSLLAQKDASDKATAATKRLNEAEQKLYKDARAGASNDALKTDAAAVRKAEADAGIQITRTSGALAENAKSADTAKYAYLGLAASIKTAGDATAAISAQAFKGFDLNLAADKSKLSFQDAVAALHDTGGATASTGGSTQTAAAAAVDRASKESSLRDAIQGVSDANRDAVKAQKELTDAHKTYLTTINGVKAGTLAAKQAQDAFTQSQDNAKSSALDLIDAQNNLRDAIEARKNASRNASEALQGASLSAASARLDVQDARANLTDAISGQDPEEIARARIALGQAELQLQQATEGVAAARKKKSDAGKKNSEEDINLKKAQIALTEAQINNRQATQDQIEAQRILNGTLHGFPPASQEAQTALNNYRDAQRTAREATDNTTDASRELFRAQNDLAGKLDTVGGAATTAGKKLTDYASKFLDVKSAAKSAAEDVAARVSQITGSAAKGILAEIRSLEDAVSLEPLLKGAFDDVLRKLEAKFAAAAYAHFTPGLTQHHVPGSNIVRRAAGGPVNGNDESGIPILAHPGEYVISRKGVDKYGLHAMDAINQGRLASFGPGSGIPNASLSRSNSSASGANVNLIVQSLDPATAGPLVVKALEEWCATNFFLPPKIRLGR